MCGIVGFTGKQQAAPILLEGFRGIKVALDCANGASWNIAKSVFDALGAKTLVINADPERLSGDRYCFYG